MTVPEPPSVESLLDNLELSDSARAILTAYTGKMFVIRFRDLQDYVEKLFGEPVPLEMFGSNTFMNSLSKKSEEDFYGLPDDIREIINNMMSDGGERYMIA